MLFRSKTLDQNYTESVLWAFSELHKKGLIYEGFKVLAYCWRCETPLSNHELRMDDEVYKNLTALWGIGPWTVDMFMMFQLGRLDIWPTGDLGVRRGWDKIHRLKDEITPEILLKRGDKFQPHRSVVAWYCWRALDN